MAALTRRLAALLLLVLQLSRVTAEEAVLTLTKDNFDETVKNTKRLLVEFYAPWCGHCKALAPEYEKAAQEMAEQNLETKLAKVDAIAEEELGKRFGVSGYPTLKYFVQGEAEPKQYDGGRTAPEIKKWLQKREVPPFNTIEESEVEEFLKGIEEGSFGVVARVVKKSSKGKAIIAAAETIVSYEAAAITTAIVFLPKTADAKSASLTVYRPGFKDPDLETVKYEGKWTDAAIASWLMTSTYPWVGTKFTATRYSQPAFDALKKDGTVVAILEDAAHREKVLSELVAIAKAEPNWLVTTSLASEMEDYELTGLGASGKSTKTMAAVVHDNKRYILTGGVEAISAPGAINGLLQSVKSKKAKPYYKTAPIPKPEVDEDGVTVLVGDTFEKYVLDAKKDVFVEFYAPWCGHCKKLTPVWAELAKKAKTSGWADKGVVIAKMDATENESEESVDGFPKLVLYPAGKSDRKMKAKQVFNGARELDPLVDFLLENAKNLEGVEDIGSPKKSSGKQKYSMVDRERERKRKQGKGEL